MSTVTKLLQMGDPGPRATAKANRTLGQVILRVDRGRRRKSVMLDSLEARMLAAELQTAADEADRRHA